jgi:hypothetical protein
MNVATERIGADGVNAWHVRAERVTAASRSIVRPSPDFAYSACVYDLTQGPVIISGRRHGTNTGRSRSTPPTATISSSSMIAKPITARRSRLVRSADARIRRARRWSSKARANAASPSSAALAPTPEAYEAAATVAAEDVCASVARPAASDRGAQRREPRANNNVTALRRAPANCRTGLSRKIAPPKPSATMSPHSSGMRSRGNSSVTPKKEAIAIIDVVGPFRVAGIILRDTIWSRRSKSRLAASAPSHRRGGRSRAELPGSGAKPMFHQHARHAARQSASCHVRP